MRDEEAFSRSDNTWPKNKLGACIDARWGGIKRTLRLPPHPPIYYASQEVEDRDEATKLRHRHADEEEEMRRSVFGM